MKCLFPMLVLVLTSTAAGAAEPMLQTQLFADPAARFLLTLAEVSVALTAFSGIAVVVGRRSVGRWTQSDVVRFTTMLVNGVMAVLFCLMPFLFFDPTVSFLESDWETLLVIVGVTGLFEVQWRVRIAWVAIKNHLDEDSNLLSLAYVSSDVLIYATLFALVFKLFDVLHFKMLSWIILYHLACAIYIFLRMVRHAGFEVVDNEG
jgi:hypothetical protein